MKKRERDYGFQIAGEHIDDKFRPIARFRCTECPATFDVPMRSGQTTNGQLVVNSAKQAGWDADAYSANKARCPKCLAFKKHNDPDSELRKTEAKMAIAPPPTPLIGAPSPPATVPIREPTADQRAMVRKLIEKHFDEDDGCYLDTMTDEKIAIESHLPPIVVARIREAAYGPIRATSEQMLIRSEITALRAKITDCTEAARVLFETAQSDLAGLRKQLDALEQRNGLKAA